MQGAPDIPPGMDPISNASQIPATLREQINIDWYLATNVKTTSLAPPSHIEQLMVTGWPPAAVALRLRPADVAEAHSVVRSKGRAVKVQNYVLRNGEFLWRTGHRPLDDDAADRQQTWFEDRFGDDTDDKPPAVLWCSYEPKLSVRPQPRACDAVTGDVAWKFTFEDDGIKAYFDSYTLTFGRQGVLRNGEAIEGHAGDEPAPIHAHGQVP